MVAFSTAEYNLLDAYCTLLLHGQLRSLHG
jgi:hypothetical protein